MLQSLSGRRRDRHSHRGFSLLEALVVVAVTLVLVALTAKGFLRAQYTYSISNAARQVAAVVQMARSKATARNNRYTVVIDATAGTYSLKYCTAPNYTTNSCPSGAPDGYTLDSPTAANNLPAGVSFAVPSGVSVAPVGSAAPTQALDMTFNSRGLLVDSTSGQSVDLKCFYVTRTGVGAMAVCSTLSGRTAVYQLNSAGNGWNEQ